MPGKTLHTWLFLLLFVLVDMTTSWAGEKIVLDYSDELNVVREGNQWVWYVVGNVDFRTESGHIYCDSAVFFPGKRVNLRGNVLLDDTSYQLKADSVRYDVTTGQAVAYGKHVELWSYRDSLFATGVHAVYHRETKRFEMDQRPVVYFRYPDTARMVEIVAEYIVYDSTSRRAEASGDVVITSQDMVATAQCAIMDTDGKWLDLYDHPVVKREKSELTGKFIMMRFTDNVINRIDIIDSANGIFIEPIDSLKTDYDRSILTGQHIILFFPGGELTAIQCYGQAYSWYYPSLRGGTDYNENSVSGDTILFRIKQERLLSVSVVGGAIGTYINGTAIKETLLLDTTKENDTTRQQTDTLHRELGKQLQEHKDSTRIRDTAISLSPNDTTEIEQALASLMSQRPVLVSRDSINYSAEYIEYNLFDSMITLQKDCKVKSDDMSLQAYKVTLDTDKRLVEAFAAEVQAEHDTMPDIQKQLAAELQPANIPVVLQDGNDELYGDYLKYSLDTKKGRIVQSKTSFEQGFYYGDKLLREQKHILYIDDAYYTTCDASVPHYHFRSSHMKLIEGNKAIAKPVVLYIGQVPVMAIPYYIFPLKRGRHSGFLTFQLGNIERGDRYVSNLGYYWAASEYWDLKSSVDYFEKRRALIFKNRVTFKKRYVLNGYINIEHSRYTSYNSSVADEQNRRDWVINGSYSHQITPSFNIDGYGSFQTSSTYYNDYSNNIDDVLNREVISKLNFSKKFGRSTSLSGQIQHTVNLDKETRTDYLPSMSLTLPALYPFGNGSKDAEGKTIQHWYNSFIFRYRPSLVNYSSRSVVDSTFVIAADTTITVDSLGIADTTITETKDTVSYRTRKKYIRIDHAPTLTLPIIRPIKYINIIPSFSYRESWYKIIETDQSRAAGIDASQTYRTYTYSGAVSANTKLYGTIYPHIAGLIGLRHVLKPSITYSWAPDINVQPEVRAFAGGTGFSSKKSTVSFAFDNLFQAKVKSGEQERSLDLLSVRTNFSYNFEADEKPLSLLSTNFSTSTIPKITISGHMSHSFYDPETDEEKFFSPALLSWNLNVNLQLAGNTFFFDDRITPGIARGADSASQLTQPLQTQRSTGGKRGWNMSISYTIDESGRHSFYSKRSQLVVNLGFNLTPVTSVNYSHTYNIAGKQTVYQRVSIHRLLHCWEGSLWWVPNGPTKGFGFKINVIGLPDLKLDNNYSSFQTRSLYR